MSQVTILGTRTPPEDLAACVADFVHQHLGPDVEIEAKLGFLLDRGGGARLSLPACSETVLSHEMASRIRFESGVPQRMFQRVNEALNRRVEELGAARRSAGQDYKGPVLQYQRKRTVDTFHAEVATGRTVRVSRDQQTNAITECVAKRRLGNLNIFCPRSALDFRISASQEVSVPTDVELGPELPGKSSRQKDRISYTERSLGMSFDLSMVRAESAESFEIEIELAGGSLAGRRPIQLAQGLVDHVRALAICATHDRREPHPDQPDAKRARK